MKQTADRVLEYMKELLEVYLEELNETDTAFVHGERTAYVECLELIQQWERAQSIGLTYDIEKKFPV